MNLRQIISDGLQRFFPKKIIARWFERLFPRKIIAQWFDRLFPRKTIAQWVDRLFPRKTIAQWFDRLFPRKTLGQRGEDAAARYLRRQGYKILARGDRSGPGELDLVMLDRKTIVFVEVKTRQSADIGRPEEAVDQQKQRRLTRLAVTFLKRHRLLNCPARFDVVAITWPEGHRSPTIDHIPNAFDAVGQSEFFS